MHPPADGKAAYLGPDDGVLKRHCIHVPLSQDLQRIFLLHGMYHSVRTFNVASNKVWTVRHFWYQ